jgi:hypothetical protein
MLMALFAVLIGAVFGAPVTVYGRHTGPEPVSVQNEPLPLNTFIQPGPNKMAPPGGWPAIANSTPKAACLAPNNTLCFQDAVEVMEVGNNVYGVAVGLLNGGSNLDVVAAAMGEDKMKIRLGCGNGAFGCGGYTWSMGDGPSDVAIADFDGDNQTDIVATNHYQGQVRIRWGHSNWSTYTHFSTGQLPWRISAADLNGDGLDDFATTNFVGGGNDDTITVRLRQAGGGFSNATYSAGPATDDIKFGDCDNDGDLDMFYTSGFNDAASIRVRENNGNGSFAAATTINLAQGNNSQLRAIALADFNEDGDLDFIASRTNHSLVRVLGTGNCTFQSIIYASVPNNPWQIYAADFNQDNHQDIIVGHGASTQITIYLGQGNGDVTGPYTIDVADHVNDLGVGDFNQDGRPDIVFSGTASVYILLTDYIPSVVVYQGLLHTVLGTAQASVLNDRLLVQNFGPSGDDGLGVQLNQARLWNGELELGFDSGAEANLTAVRAGESDRTGVSSLALQENGQFLSFSAAFAEPTYTIEYLHQGAVVLTERGLPSGDRATQVLLDELQCLLAGSPSYLCNLIIEFQQNPAGQCEWSVAFSQAVAIEPLTAGGTPILVDAIRLVEEEERRRNPLERMAFSEIQIQGTDILSLTLDAERTELEADLHLIYLPAIVK